jgi:putative two-component system response regulator
MVVDDSKTDRLMIENILHDHELFLASDGLEAMEILQQEAGKIDIIILDLNMPRMNGFKVLEALQLNPSYQNIATLILTNYDEIENEIRGLSMGAVDYIRKPLNLESLRKRIEVHANLRSVRRELENSNQRLEGIVAERTKELVVTRDITIHALIGLLEVRDVESCNHTKRTQWMMRALCERLRNLPQYSELLTDSYIKELFDTAPLHDIGKVGIPDSILLKPGRLSEAEFEIMKRHTTYGVEALHYELEAGNSVSFIQTAIKIVGSHHEKFDGSGYPVGLAGEDIPLPGRLMAIIDVYDALKSKRVYKPAFSHQDSFHILRQGRGKHFDPILLDAFFDIESEIIQITNKYVQNDD